MAQTARNVMNGVASVVLITWVVALMFLKGGDLWQTWTSSRATNASLAANWQKLIYGRFPVMGTPGASFKIVEFSDYQCPFCGAADPVLAKFVIRHKGDVVVYRYDLPLTAIHRYAYVAAVAADCAELQGVRERYQSLLFQHQKEFATVDWIALATQAGVTKEDSFATCLREEATRDRIQHDLALAKSVGLTSTPSFLINGAVVSGAVSEDKLESQYRSMHKKPSILHTIFHM